MRLSPGIRSALHATVDWSGGWPITLPDGSRAQVASNCRHMARAWEPEVVAAFMRAVRPGAVVVDVGAHWGLYSLLASRHAVRVVAVEADHTNAVMLRKNVSLSKRRIDVIEAACSDREGEVEFHRYLGTSWGLTMMGGLAPQPFTHPTKVRATTLDTLDVSPDVVKIDVEGAELQVLRGARTTLFEDGPTLIIEVHCDRLGSAGLKALSALLDASAYRHTILTRTSAGHADRTEHWFASKGAG